MPRFLPFTFLAIAAWLAPGCSSGPEPAADVAPAWVHQPSRTVDNGYIIYIGTGEDRTPERARLLAEGQALSDLANECSFAPKGARTEDRYDHVSGILHQSYVKVAVDFQSCEEAKGQIQPEEIRKLASVPMTEEIERYHDLVEDEDDLNRDEEAGLSPEAQAELAKTGPPGQYSTSGVAPVRWVVVQNEPSFLIYRQQIAYQKQTVILAPPTQFAPQSPQSQAFAAQMAGPTAQVQSFETAHPIMRTSSTTYSAMRRNSPTSHLYHARSAGFNGHPGGGQPRGNNGSHPARKPKRRRRNQP